MIEGGATPLGLGHVAAFNVALFFAVAAPGPAFILCSQAAMRGGRAEGAAVGAGLAVVAGLWTLAALAGLDALFAALPALYDAMRIGGAALILVFAVLIWRDAPRPVETTAPVSARRAFLRGAALNLANPKSILFSAGVLIVIFPPALTPAQMAAITLNHIALEIAVYSTVAAILAQPAVRERYIGWKPIIQRGMAVVLAALGLRLLATT
ncbi:LysE family translocator [Jannaschia sp. W003]|uniref:LysE family translocator n=1 Tax=Jannaschia sp. W003 TaxID=2867012 RepID=UPI0021A95E30|nr:LysE family translocator [Jannaschia sp. W003]UWQ20444.1 LysE family translocator [Jannaschia sp. W003]